MRTRLRFWLLASLSSLLAAPTATAVPLVLEMRELLPQVNPAARYVYLCETCTTAQHEAIVTPAGFEKADARLGTWSSATAVLATPPPGVPAALDFVPEIPGEEYVYVAQVLDAQLIGFDPTLGFLTLARVERDTQHVFDAGSVVHEVIDTEGNPYVLFTFDLEDAAFFDLDAVGGLSSFVLPPGWSYQSRVLVDDLVVDSEGLAHVYGQGFTASFQRYTPVPEPATWVLLSVAAAALLPRRRRA